MAKYIAISIGGWAGWWLGAHIGIMTALVLGAVGSGVSLYLYNINFAKKP